MRNQKKIIKKMAGVEVKTEKNFGDSGEGSRREFEIDNKNLNSHSLKQKNTFQTYFLRNFVIRTMNTFSVI